MSNPYAAETDLPTIKRTRRMIIEYRLPIPDPALQAPLAFDPPQPAIGKLTKAARFEIFHAENPHVYRALLAEALKLAEQGARHISVKHLYEILRASGCDTMTGEQWKLNNDFTPYYADLLAADPRLEGRIERRTRRAE